MESQVGFYLLMEKLNGLIDLQKTELDQLQKPAEFSCDIVIDNREKYDDFVKAYRDYRDSVLAITTKYQRKRNRAIWWYQHRVDVYVLCFVVLIVLVGLYFLLG